MTSNLRTSLVAFAVVGITACDSPVKPGPGDPYVGTWSGSIVDDRNGAGTLRLVITGPLGTRTSGDWSVIFLNGATGSGGAPPYAAQGDGTITIFGTCSSGAVGLKLALDGSALKGSYLGTGCSALSLGTVTLSKT